MLDGYAGTLLFVNLSDGTLEEKELTEEMARKFVGGYGIGAKVLYDYIPAGADPLGPESMLGFVTGPANATKAFFGGRYMIVHKSPVTGGWNDANSGGFFGPELKEPVMTAFLSTEFPIIRSIFGSRTEKRKSETLPCFGERIPSPLGNS